jgi:hypothetical protein
MPSIFKFDIAIVNVSNSTAKRLPEYNLRETAIQNTIQEPKSCECFIPSTPNQQFRVMVANYSGTDACVTLFVDGEWIYSGLSYLPEHNVIYFSGRLIDETTIQEMRFVDLDTTCIFPWKGEMLIIVDENEGVIAKGGLGSIVVEIHRVKVNGPYKDAKFKAMKPKNAKPILMGEKPLKVDHRVEYSL